MHYDRYFKPRQKILLHLLDSGEEGRRSVVPTAEVRVCGADHIELALPYPVRQGEGEPFAPGQHFELMADCFGMGLRVTGVVLEGGSDTILRIRPNDDLEVFSRRAYPRVDLTTTALVLRGVGTLASCRKHWGNATRAMAAGKGLPPNLNPQPMRLNLSAGGLALPLAPPVREAELCLVYLELDNRKLTLWAGCEVAWTKAASDGPQSTGLRFVAIMTDDRTRLNSFVCDELRRLGRDVEQPGRPEQLVAMTF
ncbi:MAG TPA: PilZ domain-containing protein [Geobacteraceae bacterium]